MQPHAKAPTQHRDNPSLNDHKVPTTQDYSVPSRPLERLLESFELHRPSARYSHRPHRTCDYWPIDDLIGSPKGCIARPAVRGGRISSHHDKPVIL